jgi:anion-transporting  ArsA/GET3 family ATPase
MVVNQIMAQPPADGCRLCQKRYQMHQKYLAVVRDLYGEFLRAEIATQPGEVKGLAAVEGFARCLEGLFSARRE